MFNFIQGEKFIKLAKWTYAPEVRSKDDYDNLPNTLDWILLKDGDIVYTHTCYAKQFLAELSKTRKYVKLITHNSDVNVDSSFEIPQNIIKWYSQNVAMEHPRLISIPIGLENSRWFPKLNKLEKIEKNRFGKYSVPYANLAYLNHNISTNPTERLQLYSLFESKPWVTSKRGKNGKEFDEYLLSLKSHGFVFCPNGNGIDTHRVWEALYVWCIPIIKRDLNNRFYTDLPICFVDEWDDVSEKFLNSEMKRIMELTWDLKKLSFDYWKQLITAK